MEPGTGGRRGVVTRPFVGPLDDPIRLRAGDRVTPDASRRPAIEGWTWCTDARGRAGWVPQSWLYRDQSGWLITRDFDASELSVDQGDELVVHLVEAGFLLVTARDGRRGWVPADHVTVRPA